MKYRLGVVCLLIIVGLYLAIGIIEYRTSEQIHKYELDRQDTATSEYWGRM